MKRSHYLLTWCILACTAVFASSARAFDITVQYLPGSFLDTHTTARAALEAAAADVSLLLAPTLSATNSHFESTVFLTQAYVDTSYAYQLPNSSPTTYGPTNLAPDEFTLFARGWNLTGTTLGEGSPVGLGIAAGSEAIYDTFDFETAVNNAADQASSNLVRGGPTVNTLNLTFNPPFDYISIDVSYGLLGGDIYFDTDTNNNGVTDNVATLNDYWHFDHTTTPALTKVDFYSVALHEILHTVGFGSTATWNSLVSGDDWLGSNVATLLGSGADTVSPGGDHIAQSLISESLSTGEMQTPLMVPSTTDGERRTITRLDAAFLRDIGWNLALLLGDANNDGVVDAADYLAVEANDGAIDVADGFLWGDANDDGRVDGDDFIAIEQNFGASLPGLTVPEPAVAAIMLVGFASLTRRRWAA